MKFDIFKLTEKIPNSYLKNKVIDNVLNVAIPFNLSLGMRIQQLTADKVVVKSTNSWKTKNHVGGAHACFLALLGEYPAGLLIAQNFSPENYRFIISELNVEYHKQGRGALKAVARKPMTMPQMNDDGELFLPMTTDIFNSEGDLIATAKTTWQIKDWSKVKKQ